MKKLNDFSNEELAELLQEIPGELKRRETERRARVLEEMKRLANENGYSMDELMNKQHDKTKRRSAATVNPVEPKYAKLSDPEVVWTGRGRKPAWVVEHLEKGGTLEDLLIVPSNK